VGQSSLLLNLRVSQTIWTNNGQQTWPWDTETCGAYLVVNLRDLDGMRVRALAAHGGERSRAAGRMGDVIDVVGAVEVLSVPAADGMSIQTSETWRSRR